MTCRSGLKRFWNQTRLYSFVFLYTCSNIMTGSKSSPYNSRIWFFLLSSKFQLVSTFSICSKFCVENWLLWCDLICKWVTCRSGCKRFWKSALHIFIGHVVKKKKKKALMIFFFFVMIWYPMYAMQVSHVYVTCMESMDHIADSSNW